MGIVWWRSVREGIRISSSRNENFHSMGDLRLGRSCKDSGLDSKFPGKTELTLSDSP